MKHPIAFSKRGLEKLSYFSSRSKNDIDVKKWSEIILKSIDFYFDGPVFFGRSPKVQLSTYETKSGHVELLDFDPESDFIFQEGEK